VNTETFAFGPAETTKEDKKQFSFEGKAVKLPDGDISVWTDGVALSSDNERQCAYRLEAGKKYKVTIEEI